MKQPVEPSRILAAEGDRPRAIRGFNKEGGPTPTTPRERGARVVVIVEKQPRGWQADRDRALPLGAAHLRAARLSKDFPPAQP